METVQTSVLAAASRGSGSARATSFQLHSSSGFRIETQLPEIPIIDATLGVPLILIRKFPVRQGIFIYIGFLDCLARFPLSCVPAVTVFAVGFWHDHNSLTSLILNGKPDASRERRGRDTEIW